MKEKRRRIDEMKKALVELDINDLGEYLEKFFDEDPSDEDDIYLSADKELNRELEFNEFIKISYRVCIIGGMKPMVEQTFEEWLELIPYNIVTTKSKEALYKSYLDEKAKFDPSKCHFYQMYLDEKAKYKKLSAMNEISR